jgi:homoserine/homoserine lactone efflux protein
METPLLLGLFAASALNAAIPGPSLLLVVARTAQGGLRAGIETAIGALLAVAVLLGIVMATMLGAFRLGESAFAAMQVCGIVILTLLGLRMLRAKASAGGPVVVHSRQGDLLAGFAIGAMSPFNLLFFLALIPQFIDPSDLMGQALPLVIGLVMLGSG